MTRRATLADWQAAIASSGDVGRGSDAIAALAAPKAAKYRNQKCELAGQVFDSRLERDVYRELSAAVLAGMLRGVARQVSFQLPGTRRRIRIDFMVTELDGRIRFVDAKGIETPAWSLKRQQVREAFGIDIELRRKAAKGFA